MGIAYLAHKCTVAILYYSNIIYVTLIAEYPSPNRSPPGAVTSDKFTITEQNAVLVLLLILIR